jgi:S-DNA-T family DNA segregation ATPase FtsK/SpoIIIE
VTPEIQTLNKLFNNLKIDAKISSFKVENYFFIFDVELGPTGTFKKIEKYSTEIALALRSFSLPIIYPIPQYGIVRIEILQKEMDNVIFEDVISEISIDSNDKLPLTIGRKINGLPLTINLLDLPHLLIAGTTGSGKSILLHNIINNLLKLQQDVKIALIDPKRVEFSYYNKMSKLFAPIAKDVKSSIDLLDELISEMERRFEILEKSGCRNISEYKGEMKYIVLIIDELADLMMSSEFLAQDKICRLAQKSRACGIHLIAATQRPSAYVVTGLIKANFPVKISCQVNSAIDSRVVLDRNGAEKLTGKGDAIIDGGKFKFERFKGSFISEDFILNNVNENKSWWNEIWNF